MPVITSPRQGTKSKDKFIAAVAILCVLIAGIVIYKVWDSQQIQIAVSIPGKVGSSEKGQAMKEMREKQAQQELGKGGVDTDSIDPSKASKH